uniref:Uncharacterized protein n=1 Tax=Romanomermis culicivorax TaxID=13658 RepID=A0A915HN39_ROMCU
MEGLDHKNYNQFRGTTDAFVNVAHNQEKKLMASEKLNWLQHVKLGGNFPPEEFAAVENILRMQCQIRNYDEDKEETKIIFKQLGNPEETGVLLELKCLNGVKFNKNRIIFLQDPSSLPPDRIIEMMRLVVEQFLGFQLILTMSKV